MSTQTINSDAAINRLVLIRKVAAFANLGVTAGKSFLDRASAEIDVLKGEAVDLVQSRMAISALQRNIMPSQTICQASVREVDQFLLPMRQDRRSRVEQVESSRQRPN